MENKSGEATRQDRPARKNPWSCWAAGAADNKPRHTNQ